MVQPNLIHPVKITVQRELKTATIVDADFREPVQQAARKSQFIVSGQVSWGQDQALMMTSGGATEDSDGYVLFRYIDLQRIGESVVRGDRITKTGKIDVDVYVVRVQPMGHWPDIGGATIFRAYFKDRAPSRQNRGDL